ncbi:uncharacterized protein LOC110807663 isoform X1 [Carica papaya]|uniref:uncharacterized protein LOC110807663 isoform X1 n=1 Tax=Carica papaya TaxID=3649 RepID=UPI000B8CFEF2|nr:uncharacterized protein LOC110807663 isoform X1 [Carica papaya]
MAWRQIIQHVRETINRPCSTPGSSRFFSKSTAYVVKVGIPEFLSGIGKGVETHVTKLESEIGDFQKLLVTRTLRLKKLGIPCKHWPSHYGNWGLNCCDSGLRKLILKHTHKYRLGLWRPRADSVKA